MKSIKPQLIQLLERLPLHDRQSLIEDLLRYPEMASMVTKSFALKNAGADPATIKKFEASCLEKIEQLYGA